MQNDINFFIRFQLFIDGAQVNAYECIKDILFTPSHMILITWCLVMRFLLGYSW